MKTCLFIVFFLQSACAASIPTVSLHAEVVREETPDKRVAVSLSSRFAAVRVNDFELNEALTSLVLGLPLRVAGPRFPFHIRRVLAHASVPLTGEAWSTPLARSYGHLCEQRGTPGDCLELFGDGPGLDGEDKRDIALALAVETALEARDAELHSMFSTVQLWTTLSLTLTGYMALVAAPEPVSKGVAATLAVLMWGYLGWEFLDLIRAYFHLWEEAGGAATFMELREAGDRFGKVIGPNSVRILLLLGTAAAGGGASLLSKAPKLPGFAQAARALNTRAGIRELLTAAHEADRVKVAVVEGTFSVVLPANVLSMAARGAPASSDPAGEKSEVHHIATVENEISTARGGPWTPRFKKLFDRAGMSMEDPANKIELIGHEGPHPEAYHKEVYVTLERAMKQCQGVQECRIVLTAALRRLSALIAEEGSELNQLLKRAAPR